MRGAEQMKQGDIKERDINIIYGTGYIGNEMAEISSLGDFKGRRSKNSFSRDAYPEI